MRKLKLPTLLLIDSFQMDCIHFPASISHGDPETREWMEAVSHRHIHHHLGWIGPKIPELPFILTDKPTVKPGCLGEWPFEALQGTQGWRAYHPASLDGLEDCTWWQQLAQRGDGAKEAVPIEHWIGLCITFGKRKRAQRAINFHYWVLYLLNKTSAPRVAKALASHSAHNPGKPLFHFKSSNGNQPFLPNTQGTIGPILSLI